MAECCQLVGSLDLGIDGCIISVSTNTSTEVIVACGEDPLEGSTVGTVNLTAYADTDLWASCPSKAGVSIPFIRKYDCVNDMTYFIFSGQGQSFSVGDIPSYISLNKSLPTTNDSISASSSAGPAAIYTKTTQYNGYGMTYTGDPISFETTAEGTQISLGGVFASNVYYLQNFSFDAQPGQFPIVTYTLVYAIGG